MSSADDLMKSKSDHGHYFHNAPPSSLSLPLNIDQNQNNLNVSNHHNQNPHSLLRELILQAESAAMDHIHSSTVHSAPVSSTESRMVGQQHVKRWEQHYRKFLQEHMHHMTMDDSQHSAPLHFSDDMPLTALPFVRFKHLQQSLDSSLINRLDLVPPPLIASSYNSSISSAVTKRSVVTRESDNLHNQEGNRACRDGSDGVKRVRNGKQRIRALVSTRSDSLLQNPIVRRSNLNKEYKDENIEVDEHVVSNSTMRYSECENDRNMRVVCEEKNFDSSGDSTTPTSSLSTGASATSAENDPNDTGTYEKNKDDDLSKHDISNQPQTQEVERLKPEEIDSSDQCQVSQVETQSQLALINDGIRKAIAASETEQAMPIRQSRPSQETIYVAESNFDSSPHYTNTRRRHQHSEVQSVRHVHSESVIDRESNDHLVYPASDCSIASSTISTKSAPKSSSSPKGSFMKNVFRNLGLRRRNSKHRKPVSRDEFVKYSSRDSLDTTLRQGAEKNLSRQGSVMKKPVGCSSTRSLDASGASMHSHSSRGRMMKVLFTEFHNSQTSGYDSVDPYLGDNSSVHNGKLYNMYGPVERTPQGMRLSCSLEESRKRIDRERTLLLPLEGTETWTKGNRYLIAPALLTQCPQYVLDHFWTKNTVRLSSTSRPKYSNSPRTTLNQNDYNFFGRIFLGGAAGIIIDVSMAQVDANDWLPRKFVLCQNYLLEYDSFDDMKSQPKGYVHLQNALVSAHPLFLNALEIEFVEDPYSLGHKRKLLLRLPAEEARDAWVEALSKAASLSIDDLYDFQQELAHGRYASIYRGKRKRISKNGYARHQYQHHCALKVIDKNEFWGRVYNGRERVDTLVREVAVQATLTSGDFQPFFVHIYGIFETAENFVLELEMLEGIDLFRHVSSRTVLEENEAALIMRDILISLATTRRLGIAHRDVKLANILMCNNCANDISDVSVKLADYGMATFVGVDGLVRGRCGTPGYVAPEIFAAGTNCGYGNKVDLFSAGVIMYVLLCGYEPFYGETDAQLIAANKAAVAEFDEFDWGNISSDARDLVSRLLEINPDERIDAIEALRHPWIVQRAPPSKWMKQNSGRNTSKDDSCVIS